MAHSVEMPELGESVTEGTITTWLKEVGDTVEVDEPLLEVSTDKVDTEIPSPVAGVILEIKADEDDTVEIGDVIAIIGDEGEEADSSSDSSDSDEAEDAEDDDADAEEQDEAPKDEEKKSSPKSSGDATDVAMPELGESVTEGTITTWLKEVGDEVEVDEPLLEVSTDKVDTEIPSPVAGTLIEILADEDDTVEVGDVIARIGDADAAASGNASDDDSNNGSAEENVAEEDEKVEDDNSAKGEGDNPEDAPKKDAAKSSSKNKKGSGESTKVEMPELGESVTEGTITTWLKAVGDLVEVDEPLLEVSTDKVDTEIPSPVEGTILEILAEEDDTVEVGQAIVIIGDAEAAAEADDETETADEPEATDEPAEQEEEAEAKPEPEQNEEKPAKAEKQETESKNASAKVNNGGNVPYVTPLVRKLADKHGVDPVSYTHLTLPTSELV